MKKMLALICALVMLLSLLLAACGGGKPADGSEEESSVTAEDSSGAGQDGSGTEPVSESGEDRYLDENGKYVNKNQVAFRDEWKERKEFRVLVYSNNVQTTYFSEEIESFYETTDDKIREAVDTRNREIEDKYGITVKAVAVDDVASRLRDSLASDPVCDAAMPFMYAAAVFAQDGQLYNLCDFEGYLDIYAPWWDQNANESLSIANKIYFTTGDISIMQKIVSGGGLAFNKKLLDSYFPGLDIYELVDRGEWTFDKYYSMCKEVTHDLNDDGVMDENDFWGALSAGSNLYFSGGEPLCSKDPNDYPVINIGNNERSIAIMQKALELLNDKRTWNITADEFTVQAGKWDTLVRIFGEGRALFAGALASAIKKYRKYDVVFGIVPAPKYDVEQDGYHGRCSNVAYGVCIPTNVEDPYFSAYMLDLLAVGGKNYLTKAYYEATLKGKDMDTAEDERMLDLVYSGVFYDISAVYRINELEDLLKLDQPDQFSQQLQSVLPIVEGKLEEIVERYENS
ncbi:MAG: extracellular solute-binding protein [Clostridia bacterium]|nr:extracellular solute-binding protein [Clostridia bacterium]